MEFKEPLLRLPIRFDAKRLSADVESLGEDVWTAHPTGFAGNDAVALVSPGGQLTDALRGAMAPTRHLLASPYIMAIMGELGGVWGRSRLMRIAPGAEVPEHVDIHYYWRTHIRIHIPVITDPEVVFTCGGVSVHMAPGECWIFDSFRMHDVQNRSARSRVHLVLDTVGGDRLWELIDAAEAGAAASDAPTMPSMASAGDLKFEQINSPKVMTPWEIRCHIDYLRSALVPGAEAGPVLKRLDRFVAGWLAAWTRFGESDDGLETYRELVAAARRDVDAMGGKGLPLVNGAPLAIALNALIFSNALAAPANRPGQQAQAQPARALP